MRICYFVFLLVFSCFGINLSAQEQDFSSYQKSWLVQGADTLPYRILYPPHYDSTRRYPVVFFLHGAGERGNDNASQLLHGGSLFLQEKWRDSFPAFVVFPQCSRTSYWSNVLRVNNAANERTFFFLEDGIPTKSMQLLMELVRYITAHLPVKMDQVYVGGLSMGGMGTYEVVRRIPNTFAAAFAICGGAHTATAPHLTKADWWIFHGLKDDVVDPAFSKQMAASLKTSGAAVKLTLYPDANHNSWDSAFSEQMLLPWLFSKHKR